MGNKLYCLKDFTSEEISRAKQFIKMAVIGYYTVKLDQHVDELIGRIGNIPFLPDDNFTLTFEIKTIGNDILTALGVARYEQQSAKK